MRRLAIISTGGTIAMAAQGRRGADLALTGPDLAAGLKLDDVEVVVSQPFSRPSASIGPEELRSLAAAAMEAARTCDGVVITHGTDTLEETAFSLFLQAPGPAPVVLTGAMRHADAPGADGPANLAAAARTALSAAARDLGVLVVMGDEIHSAAYARKVNASRVNAFSSAPLGPLGWVTEDRVRVLLRPTFRSPALAWGPATPRVPVVALAGGDEASWLETVAASADGLVVSLMGGGHAPDHLAARLGEIARTLPVVFASRTGGGETLRTSYAYAGGEIDLLDRGLIGAGFLDAPKARIALTLLQSGGAGTQGVRDWFGSLAA